MVVSPLVVEETLVGALVVGAAYATGGLVRAADEVALWVSASSSSPSSTRSRTRTVEAERALRAQISACTPPTTRWGPRPGGAHAPRPARASVRAADFTRARRSDGDYTDAGRGLRFVERQPPPGAGRRRRLKVTLRIDGKGAGLSPVAVLHTSVEYAARHGLEGECRQGGRQWPPRSRPRPRPGVCDRGRGRRHWRGPQKVRRALATRSMDSVGLGNVERGLRTPSATTTVWSSRPLPALTPRSSYRCPSSPPECW